MGKNTQMVPGDLLDMGKTTQRGTPDRRAIKSEANCLANDGAISRGRVTSRTVPACGRGYILGYPYSFAASVSQLAVRSLGADDCASQTRHREQFGTYDEGASAPVRPTVLKCARLRFPAVSGWDCHELHVSPGDRGIQVQQRCAVRKARLEMFRSGNLAARDRFWNRWSCLANISAIPSLGTSLCHPVQAYH